MTRKKLTQRADIYTRITDRIVASLEQGTRPWMKPWNAEHAAGRITKPLQHNGTPYNGINIIMLWQAATACVYRAPIWMTYRQAKELGAQVRKGEKGELVVYIMWQAPDNGLTALHIVAACQARKVLRVLLDTGECDFLMRDSHGRLPSEMGYLLDRDVAVARLLGNKEREQAQALGVKLTRRPKPGSSSSQMT